MDPNPNSAAPSSSLSSSSSSAAEADISDLQKAVSETATLSSHLALISGLRQTADLPQLRAARTAATIIHPLPESAWLEYLADESALATTPEEKNYVVALHTRALSDFSTPSLHAARLVYALELLSDGVITDQLVTQFSEDAFGHGAGYDEAFKAACHKLPSSTHGFQEPPQEAHVFEKRISETPPSHAGKADEARIVAFLFYANFAEASPLFAVSIYERALSEAFSAPELWKRYDDFLSRTGGSRSDVLKRACRAVPQDMDIWRRCLSVADTTGIVEVLHRAREYVMKSDDLPRACRLTKEACTRFLSLGCPATAKAAVEGSLEFNLPESVQWASAAAHMAATLKAMGDFERMNVVMENVVSVRPEVRWFLAYAALLEGDEKRDVYERGLRNAGSVGELHVLRDAWECFEVMQGAEGLMKKMDRISAVADAKSGERLKESNTEREKSGKGARQHGKPAKRRRAEKGEKVRDERGKKKTANGQTEKRSEKRAARGIGDSDDKMEEDSKDKIPTKPNGVDCMEASAAGGDGNAKDVETDAAEGAEPNTVFLNNLAFSVTDSDLTESFSFAGEIRQIRLPKRSDGATKGIAYIEFADDSAVQKALTKHNKPIKGRAVWVRRSRPPARKGRAPRGRGRGRGRGGGRGRGRGGGAARGGMQPMGRRRARLDVKNDPPVENGDVEMADGEDQPGGGLGQDDFRAMLKR